MAENAFQFRVPKVNMTYVADITNIANIVEEGPKICPLCSSVVRLYYVDFFTRIFMCTNMLCEYPFGHNFTIYTSDDDKPLKRYGIDLTRVPRRRYQKPTGNNSVGQSSTRTSTIATNSNLSSSEWGEMNPPSQTYDSDDNMSTTSSKKFARKASERLMKKRAKKQEDEDDLKQKVEKIKECNKVLFDSGEDFETIRNAKWIQNLSTMQSSSGMRLVKDHELQKLKQAQNNICHGELKIDIDAKKDSMSSIVIEIGKVLNAGNHAKPI